MKYDIDMGRGGMRRVKSSFLFLWQSIHGRYVIFFKMFLKITKDNVWEKISFRLCKIRHV